jgi:polysaccharide deacetylase 2 family uncharacterized protein YibQ
MLPLRVMASTSAATVSVLTIPKNTSTAVAPSGPKAASAIGRARMPPPTVSVRVSA